MNILSIGYGRNLFDPNNPERKRMERCAQEVESLHMIIFTLKKDGLSEVSTTHGLTIHPTNSASKIHMIFDAIRIGKKVIRTQGSSWVITTQDPFEAGIVGLFLARREKLPLNVQEHGDYFSTEHWRNDSLHNQLRYFVGISVLRSAHIVRVVSKRIAETLKKKGVASDAINYLPVRTDTIQSEHSSFDLHAEYPDHSTIVLSMGRLVSQKNLPLLMRSFADLYVIDQRALLLVVGSGPELPKLQALSDELGVTKNVVFIPWTNNPYAYMQSADIFTLSSNWEGWARVLIEAMSAGTPAVTTDVGCAGEVFIDGEHGFVVPVGDTSAFSQRLIELAGDTELREPFGAQAQQAVKRIHIPLDTYAHMWGEVFKKTRERCFTSK